MKLQRRAGGGFTIEGISATRLHVFRHVPADADASAVEGAEDRLYPDPVAPEDDDGVNDDWEKYVSPTIYDRFSADVSTYERDVSRARPAGDDPASPTYTIEVPDDHVEPWFSALNQARLVLNERHHFPEESGRVHWLEYAKDGRLEPYLRMRFYGLIQEWIVENFMG